MNKNVNMKLVYLLSTSKTDMALTDECKSVYFLQQICNDVGNNIFKTPWGSVMIHNCDETGKLLEFKSMKEYHDSGRNLWLNLTLMLFRQGHGIFPVWCCPECPSMRGFTSMGVQNKPEDFLQYLCLHSKAASFILPNWETFWNVNLDPGVTSHEVICNENIAAVTCKENKKGQLFLAAVRADNKVYILQTVTKRQTAPICTTFPAPFCTTAKCVHFRKYKTIIEEEDYRCVFDPKFSRSVGTEEDEEQLDVDNGAQNGPEESDTESVESNSGSNEHYLHELGQQEFAKMCGYNFSKIPYPFKISKVLQTVYLKRIQHIYDFPSVFAPTYSDSLQCPHGYNYDSNNDNLVKDSENVVIINEIGEQIFETKVMCRRTLGSCRCLQHYDGHPELLWHLGKGRFVNYCLLLNFLHNFVNDGLSIYAQFKSIKDNNETNGIISQVTYNDIHRATVGFFRNLEFDETLAFSCPKHGTKPKWITADGKNLGPSKKKCKNMSELDRHPDDDQILPQSTVFQDRVFLPDATERSLVCALLGDQMSLEEFLLAPDIESDNGNLILDLVFHLHESGPDIILPPYKRFIKNVCKPTSARGLLQVTNFLPLHHLASFCREELAIKDVKNLDKLQTVGKELPVLWPMLNDICNLEKKCYLPPIVSRIVLKLLEIRMNSFVKSTSRTSANYIPYVGPEHPNMCYPNHKIKQYPKKYKVSQKTDEDLCKKAFIGHSDFTAGIFTVGCACEYNITFG